MKKKQALVLCLLTLVVFLMGAVLLYTVCLYRGTGLSEICTLPEGYTYNGKVLLSEEKTHALITKTLGKTEFEKLELQTLDLTSYGFEKESLSYYQYGSEDAYGVKYYLITTPDPSYEGFWPVMKPDRLIYVAKDGAKYVIHPKEEICYPIFSDSIDSVDPYGKGVLAFSGNGSFAISLEGDVATVYHTDPMDDSLRVVETKEISLAAYGPNIRFGAFAGNTTAYLMGDKGYFALDCATGETAASLLDTSGEYGEPINRVYAQRLDGQDEKLYARWSHLLLGDEYHSPVLKGFDSIELIAVSPEGTYAVGAAEGESDEILVLSRKRSFSLSSVLKEGETVTGVDFVYENLIFVHLLSENDEPLSRCYKVCF